METDNLLSKLTAAVSANSEIGGEATMAVAKHLMRKRLSKWSRFVEKWDSNAECDSDRLQPGGRDAAADADKDSMTLWSDDSRWDEVIDGGNLDNGSECSDEEEDGVAFVEEELEAESERRSDREWEPYEGGQDGDLKLYDTFYEVINEKEGRKHNTSNEDDVVTLLDGMLTKKPERRPLRVCEKAGFAPCSGCGEHGFRTDFCPANAFLCMTCKIEAAGHLACELAHCNVCKRFGRELHRRMEAEREFLLLNSRKEKYRSPAKLDSSSFGCCTPQQRREVRCARCQGEVLQTEDSCFQAVPVCDDCLEGHKDCTDTSCERCATIAADISRILSLSETPKRGPVTRARGLSRSAAAALDKHGNLWGLESARSMSQKQLFAENCGGSGSADKRGSRARSFIPLDVNGTDRSRLERLHYCTPTRKEVRARAAVEPDDLSKTFSVTRSEAASRRGEACRRQLYSEEVARGSSSPREQRIVLRSSTARDFDAMDKFLQTCADSYTTVALARSDHLPYLRSKPPASRPVANNRRRSPYAEAEDGPCSPSSATPKKSSSGVTEQLRRVSLNHCSPAKSPRKLTSGAPSRPSDDLAQRGSAPLSRPRRKLYAHHDDGKSEPHPIGHRSVSKSSNAKGLEAVVDAGNTTDHFADDEGSVLDAPVGHSAERIARSLRMYCDNAGSRTMLLSSPGVGEARSSSKEMWRSSKYH